VRLNTITITLYLAALIWKIPVWLYLGAHVEASTLRRQEAVDQRFTVDVRIYGPMHRRSASSP
jgi:hypothetical protein